MNKIKELIIKAIIKNGLMMESDDLDIECDIQFGDRKNEKAKIKVTASNLKVTVFQQEKRV